MAMKSNTMKSLCAGLALALGLFSDGDLAGIMQGRVGSEAQARVIVVPRARVAPRAGVARRTTRRVIRRTGIYVNHLPAGCIVTHYDGVAVWHCGTHYYERHGGRYVRVTIH